MPDPTAAFERAVDALYARGTNLRQKYAKLPTRYATGFVDEALKCDPRYTNADALRKAMVLADPDRGYTRTELAELKARVRAAAGNFTAPNVRFGVTHLLRLLAVPKARGERDRLLARCLKGGWSTAELEAEIRKRNLRRGRSGGRRPRVGKTATDVLAHLALACDSWGRLARELERRADEPGGLAGLDDLPAEVAAAFRKAASAVAKLHDALPAAASTKRAAAGQEHR
jgi:hypothetical protein